MDFEKKMFIIYKLLRLACIINTHPFQTSVVFHIEDKICFALQNKLLVSRWNTELGGNGLINLSNEMTGNICQV